jgi:predicted HAD superfamily Cof-like phosphohydrolase
MRRVDYWLIIYGGTMDPFECIKDFHKKFGLTYEGKPRTLPKDLRNFRTDFMEEELNEYAMAAAQENKHDQLDALVDLVYVVLGTAYMQGFDFNEAFKRVHEANMKKVRAVTLKDSKRGSIYDVVKPEGWTAPDLNDLV